MNHFRHPDALVESGRIGKGTRIWAFAHILPGALVGEDCNICDHTFIENDVVIGDRVTVKCGVQLWDGAIIEDDVFIGPNATFTNDRFPRSGQRPDRFEKTIVRRGASVGANATILPGVVIGMNAMIGAGAVVTKSVPPNAIVTGSPARITGYVSSKNRPAENRSTHGESLPASQTGVPGVRLFTMPVVNDMRGRLSFGEVDRHLPFSPKRYFIVFDVPSKDVRGEHAHRELHQFLVCIRGSCAVVVDDGENRDEIALNGPATGLHIPPMIWATQYKYSGDAVLLVLASDIYRPEDYIRDYDEFRRIVGR